MESRNIKSDAGLAIRYSNLANGAVKVRVGGNKLTRKPKPYGIALKWLIYTRRMTYEQFGKKYNGSTAQNINHLINRTQDIYDEELQKMCEVLDVEFEYFTELCKEIESISKGKKNG